MTKLTFQSEWLYDSRLRQLDHTTLMMLQDKGSLVALDMKQFGGPSIVRESFRRLHNCGLAELDLEGRLQVKKLKRTKPTPTGDSEAFEAVWKAYPDEKGRSSKNRALSVYSALPDAHKVTMAVTVANYKKSLAPRDIEFVPAMERWLRERKYERFMPKVSPAEDKAAVRRGALSVFIASGRWDNSAGSFPTDEEVDAFKASRPVKTELF